MGMVHPLRLLHPSGFLDASRSAASSLLQWPGFSSGCLLLSAEAEKWVDGAGVGRNNSSLLLSCSLGFTFTSRKRQRFQGAEGEAGVWQGSATHPPLITPIAKSPGRVSAQLRSLCQVLCLKGQAPHSWDSDSPRTPCPSPFLSISVNF